VRVDQIGVCLLAAWAGRSGRSGWHCRYDVGLFALRNDEYRRLCITHGPKDLGKQLCIKGMLLPMR
jgi:hypothetical protein